MWRAVVLSLLLPANRGQTVVSRIWRRFIRSFYQTTTANHCAFQDCYMRGIFSTIYCHGRMSTRRCFLNGGLPDCKTAVHWQRRLLREPHALRPRRSAGGCKYPPAFTVDPYEFTPKKIINQAHSWLQLGRITSSSGNRSACPDAKFYPGFSSYQFMCVKLKDFSSYQITGVTMTE